MRVFFSDDDYRYYLRVLGDQAQRHSLAIWAYCLMPNHVHLVVVPETEEGLARPVGEAHRRYALVTNARKGWTGHLWQERFASFPMDEVHLIAAVRYVLLNPVRAGLTRSATDWPHSSARSHVYGEPDPLIRREPVDERVPDWKSFLLNEAEMPETVKTFRNHSGTGRPLGSDTFLSELEEKTGRRLRKARAGRKPKRK